jgi:cold shock CspA family protein
MPIGTVRGYDKTMASGYIVEIDGTRRDFSSLVDDIAPGHASQLYNGVSATYTPYTGNGGGLRARQVSLSTGLQTAVPPQAIMTTGTAIISRYDNGFGGYITDDETDDDLRFSDHVVTPANVKLEEGDRVSFVRYANSRRGVWAKSVKPIL